MYVRHLYNTSRDSHFFPRDNGVEHPPIAVIGAGMGGLSAALTLAARGRSVLVLEAADEPGGKMRQVSCGGAPIDAGPTVFTMRWVFEELFAALGASLEEWIEPQALDTLARHSWGPGEQLDLFADRQRTADAIAGFAGPAEGRRYLAFCASAARTYQALERPFLCAPRPNPLTLSARVVAAAGLPALFQIRPFSRLFRALQGHFRDPRLQQLFGRYATYCGSSPYLAPATLMLVAHVEQTGVWVLPGGMQRLAASMRALAEQRGVRFRFGEAVREIRCSRGRVSHVVTASGEEIPCSAAICNADPAALRAGLFGAAAKQAIPGTPPGGRSLSAITWALEARTRGFPLLHHNVFFSSDYRREFNDILRRGSVPAEPTVYVCAQDRDPDGRTPGGRTPDGRTPGGRIPGGRIPGDRAERLLCLVNAPATGDSHPFDSEEIDACAIRTFQMLARCGLQVTPRPEATVVTTPRDFARLFPATGGALYGMPSHGWQATFRRPGSRTRIPGLYLAGGGTHPGPGVPMAALSGRLAAQTLLQDRTSRSLSSPAAIAGGTSMR
jgi:1-hydroxycarotenoid 3,4-desaturase